MIFRWPLRRGPAPAPARPAAVRKPRPAAPDAPPDPRPATPGAVRDADGYERGLDALDAERDAEALALTEAACQARSYDDGSHFESYSVWKARGVIRDRDGTPWFSISFHAYGCSSYGWGRSDDGSTITPFGADPTP